MLYAVFLRPGQTRTATYEIVAQTYFVAEIEHEWSTLIPGADTEGVVLVNLIDCRARVLRSEDRGNGEEYRLAFGFDRLTPEARVVLNEFIARKLSNDSPGDQAIMTDQIDICANGLSCKSETFIPPFREVRINMLIPSERDGGHHDTVECSGVVVRCDPEEAGGRFDVDLYFTDITEAGRLLLQSYLKDSPSVTV